MDLLSDLLNTHTVVNQYVNDPDLATTQPSMFTDNSLDSWGEDPMRVCCPVTFDTRPTITSSVSFMYSRYIWDGNISYNGTTSTYMKFYFKYCYPMTAGKISLQVACRAGSGAYTTGTSFDVDVHDTVVFVQKWSHSSTTWTLFLDSYLLDKETGELTLLQTFATGAFVSEVATGSHEDFSSFITYGYNNVNLEYKLKIYEPSVFIGKHTEISLRMYQPVGRNMEYVYYSHDNWVTFVLPPLSLFNGSAYDRTDILESQIDSLNSKIVDLDTLIDDLQTDLDSANVIIQNLEDELSSGGTIFDSIASILSDAGDTLDTLTSGGDLWERLSSVNLLSDAYDKIDTYFDTHKLFEIEEGS